MQLALALPLYFMLMMLVVWKKARAEPYSEMSLKQCFKIFRENSESFTYANYLRRTCRISFAAQGVPGHVAKRC
jgi:hypothetical protein